MAGINEFRDKAKDFWMKSMKAIGDTAADIASSTRSKVDEMALQNRRRDALQHLAETVYALWQQGEPFPPEMIPQLKDLQELDEKLNVLRTEEAAQGAEQPEPEAGPEEEPQPEEAPAAEEDDAEFVTDMEAHMLRQEEETSLQGAPDAVRDEINARFDRQGVEKKARKVNASLDELSEQMRRFDEAAENKENQ